MPVGLSSTAVPLRSSRPSLAKSDDKAKHATPSDRFYRPELNVIRFMAFFAVFVHHFSIVYVLRQGTKTLGFFHSVYISFLSCTALGLDLFFCLSAFLISTLLLREMDRHGTVRVGAFLMRRILRIWPLYVAAILLGAFVVPRLIPGEKAGYSYLLALTCFVANWYCTFRGYSSAFLSSLWSLSAEQQFYVVCPFMMRWLSRQRLLFLACASLALATAARGFILWWGFSHAAIWTNPVAHLDPFAVGLIFGLVAHRIDWRPSLPLRTLLIGAGIIACPVAIFFLGSGVYYNQWSFLFYPLAAVSVCAVLAGFLNLGSVRWPSALLWLGDLSYGMFVFHVFGIYLARQLFLIYMGSYHLAPMIVSTVEIVLAFLMTLGLAIISYRYLELPFMKLKGRFTLIKSGRPSELAQPPAAGLPPPVAA